MTKIKIFKVPPEDYNPTLEVAGCFCEWDGKVLFLKRHPHKPAGEQWGIPAGKIEPLESVEAATIREVFEETGFVLDPKKMKEVIKQYVRYDSQDFIFHVFYHRFDTCPVLVLEQKEHVDAKWVTIEEAFELDLMPGASETLGEYKEYKKRCG